MHSFEVHSNESACRKSGGLGLDQVRCDMILVQDLLIGLGLNLNLS